MLVDPNTGSVEVIMEGTSPTGSAGGGSPSMRLIPRPPDSPDALNRYLETVGHTISDEAEALEMMLGARIPAPGQQQKQQKQQWAAPEDSQETEAETSLHTHRPPPRWEEATPAEEAPSLHTHRPLLSEEDGDTEQDSSEVWVAEEALPLPMRPMNAERSMDGWRSIGAEEALPSPRHMLDGDGAAEVEWAQQQQEEWEQGEPGTPRSAAITHGMDLETATRLNSELQQQLASKNTATTAARLAGVVVNSVDDSQGEASWAQLLRADSRNSHGTPTREMIPAWSPPAGLERSFHAVGSIRAERPMDAEWSPMRMNAERSTDAYRSSLNASGGSYDDVRPPEPRGVPQELLDLREALTVANAARRAAEGTLQNVISGEPPVGYTLGRVSTHTIPTTA